MTYRPTRRRSSSYLGSACNEYKDFAGYDFWLAKLNSISSPNEDVRDDQQALARVRKAEMVRAFIESLEYRRRFGPP